MIVQGLRLYRVSEQSSLTPPNGKIKYTNNVYINMAKNSRKRNSKPRGGKTRGGSAWQYTTAAYGGPEQQVAGAGRGNEIAANNLSGQSFCAGGSALKKGGSDMKKGGMIPKKGGTSLKNLKNGGSSLKQGGSAMLADVAVPAVLLYANTAFKGKFGMSKRNKYSKIRRTFRRKP